MADLRRKQREASIEMTQGRFHTFYKARSLMQDVFVAALGLLAMLIGTQTTNAQPQDSHKQVYRPPVPARVQSLQINKPFTLVYNVSATSKYNGTMQTRPLRVSISSDGKSLLFRAEETDTHITHTYLYKDRETFTMGSNSRVVSIEPGFDSSRWLFLPLPGTGIPNQSLLFCGFEDGSETLPQFVKKFAPELRQEERIIGRQRFNSSGQYRGYGIFRTSDHDVRKPDQTLTGFASVVVADSPGGNKALWYATYESPTPGPVLLWEYFQHRQFQGVQIAEKMRMRRWFTGADSAGKTVRIRDAAYTLEHAIDGMPKPESFRPESYLLNHSNITDGTTEPLKSFIYYAGKGSIESQREGAIGVRRALAKTAQPKASTSLRNSILAASLLVALGTWRLLRRRL